MLKQRYVEFEKSLLEDAPFSPYELTAEGLAELRRSIIISILSLLGLCLTVFYAAGHGTPYKWGYYLGGAIADGGASAILAILEGVCAVGVFVASVYFLIKSCEHLTETGLFIRTNVTDGHQDEWELEQKRKYYTFAYETIGWAVIGLFFLGLLFCGLHALFADGLPNPPRFGVVVTLFVMAIWIYSVLPVSYLAWTLEPVEEDQIDGPITKPAKSPKPVLTGMALWKKRAWDWCPIIVGLIGGVLWATYT